MGRKRAHDEATGIALLEAAEALIGDGGLRALSVRAVAEHAGTTTRAVYTVFGSKAGLEQALVGRTFQVLGRAVEAVPLTDDARADLIEVVTIGFRSFVRAHTDLFRLVFTPGERVGWDEAARAESMRAWEKLLLRIRRAQDAGVAGPGDPFEIALGFNALCTGLGIMEICGQVPADVVPRLWEATTRRFVDGLAGGYPGTTARISGPPVAPPLAP